MTKKIILFSFIAFIAQTVYAQELMSKKEIYLKLKNIFSYQENPENYKRGFDSIVAAFIDTLKTNNIDTIGAYALDYFGVYTKDSCSCGTIPWEAYVHWIDNGVTFHKKFTKCCYYESIRIDYSVIINYYSSAKSKIDDERIMRAITGTQKGEDGEIYIHATGTDNTTAITLYCTLNEHSRYTRFLYDDLIEEKGIFQKDNENTAINSWRKMIDNQIHEIENR